MGEAKLAAADIVTAKAKGRTSAPIAVAADIAIGKNNAAVALLVIIVLNSQLFKCSNKLTIDRI